MFLYFKMTNANLCWVQGLCAHKLNGNIPSKEMIVIAHYSLLHLKQPNHFGAINTAHTNHKRIQTLQ